MRLEVGPAFRQLVPGGVIVDPCGAAERGRRQVRERQRERVRVHPGISISLHVLCFFIVLFPREEGKPYMRSAESGGSG